MRLSSRSRSIITEARRVVETGAPIQTVKVIVLKPGEEFTQPAEEGVAFFIIQLNDKKPVLDFE